MGTKWMIDDKKAIVSPELVIRQTDVCTCRHRAVDHWRGAGVLHDCAIKYCKCQKFTKGQTTRRSETIRGH